MSHPYIKHPRPLAFGHRGAAGQAPENTLASIRMACDAGVDGIELDIHPTADGVPVVIHDDTVDRCTNGTGRVREMSLAQLQELDAGYTFSPPGSNEFPFRGKGVKVPTLAQVMEATPGLRINIDFKDTSAAMEDQVASVLEQYKAHDRVLVCSSTDHLSPRVRRRFPQAATSACTKEVTRLVLLNHVYLGFLAVPSVDALQIPPSQYGIPVLTPRLVRLAHSYGLDVHVWTINETEEMRRYLDWGVDAIMSDYPDRLIEVMRQAGAR